MLEQTIGTPMQQRWITKLLGFDFLVEYKKGQENRVVDALSWQFEESLGEVFGSLFLIYFPTVNWLIELKQSYANDSMLQKLLKKVNKGQSSSRFSIKEELLFYKGRLYVPKNLHFINKLLHLLHSHPKGCHSGVDKTLYRVRRNFFW